MPKFWSRLRLHVQVAIVSATLLAITITISTWYNVKSQQETLIENTTHEATSLAKSISIISSYLVITNKLDELESLLVQSVSFPNVSRLRILSSENKPLSHVKKRENGDVIVDFNLDPISAPSNSDIPLTNINWNKNLLITWHPIVTSTTIGWTNLEVDLNNVIELQNQFILENIISAVFAIILDILSLLLILSIPARSLNKITKFAEAMSKRPGETMDFSGGSREINILVDALNNSSLELDNRNIKIINQSNDLQNLNEQQETLEKEIKHKKMLDSLIESVITINDEGIVSTFNQAAETLFGYTQEEVIGNNIVMLMPDPYAHEHQSYLNNYMHGGKAKVIGIGREVKGKKKNGDVFPMRLSVTELPEGSDLKRYFIGSCQDLTQQKIQEEQLRRTQKMDALGKLTGGVAHDYNNILAIIKGYNELIRYEIRDNPMLISYIEEVDHATDRGAKLAKKILGFSKHKIPVTSVVSLNTILKRMQFMLEKTLSVRIKLIFKLEENLWDVEIDSNDFEDCIINMAINAIHAMDSVGNFIVTTRNTPLSFNDAQLLNLQPGDYVALTLIDSGKGIDEATKEKMFDPFFTTKGEYGSGLGLSQVYGFIERSNGSIKVFSNLGEGAQFTLYFPKSKKQSESEAIPDFDNNHDKSGCEKILVVDDEASIADLTHAFLATHNYRVRVANSGLEALEILKQEHFDLVISDIIMPDLDGYELSEKIQTDYPGTKIQLITGFSDNLHKEKYNSVLHKNRLLKPFSSIQLLEKIRLLLDNSI